MNRLLKNKLVICLIIIMVVSVGHLLAYDVTVQNGTLTTDNDINVDGLITGSDLLITNGSYNYLYFDDYTFVLDNGISMYVDDTVWIDGAVYAGNDLSVNGDIEADSITIGNQSYLWIDEYGVSRWNVDDYYDYIGIGDCLYVGSYTPGYYEVFVDGEFTAAYTTFLCDDLFVFGKIESSGGYDPPYVLYDQQSREEIIERVRKEVSPDKQNGAAMFFNKETKKLETYVASEGKFYDLEGNLIHELAAVVEPTTKYETVYHFDSMTGQARPILRPVQEKFQIKEGYALDDKTGNFMNKNTKQAASREEALEICVASEGKIYDLNHNFVRNIEKNQSDLPRQGASTAGDITAAGNNSLPNQIKTAQNNTENQEMTVAPASFNK